MKVFWSSTQLTEQHGLYGYSGVFSLSHRVIKIITDSTKWIEVRIVSCVILYIYEIIVSCWMNRCKAFPEEIDS